MKSVTGGSVFTFALFNLNPVFTIILTIVPRTLEGLLTGLIFKALHNIKSVQKISYYVASLCCPLLNTLLFMSTLVALFYRTDFIQTYVAKFGVGNPFSFVVAFVGRYGGDEFMVVIYNTSKTEIEDILMQLSREKDSLNSRGNDMPIDYACGWAISDADGECTIQMLLDKADYYMYENKQSRKKSMQSTK